MTNADLLEPIVDADADAKDAIVEQVEQYYYLGAAARRVGVRGPLAYEWLDTDPDFAERVAAAQRIAADMREMDVWQAARSGDPAALKASLEVAKRLDAHRVKPKRTKLSEPAPEVRRFGHESTRPTKLRSLDPELVAKFCDIIAHTGLPLADACKILGVHPNTYHEWMRRGRERKSGIFAEFRIMVDQARAIHEARLVDAIVQSSLETTRTVKRTVRVGADGEEIVETVETEHPPDIRGAEFLLRTRYAERYSEKLLTENRSHHTVESVGPPTEVTFNFVRTGVDDDDGDGAVASRRILETAAAELLPADPLDPAHRGDAETDTPL